METDSTNKKFIVRVLGTALVVLVLLTAVQTALRLPVPDPVIGLITGLVTGLFGLLGRTSSVEQAPIPVRVENKPADPVPVEPQP